MPLPKELVKKGLLVLKNKSTEFGAEPVYTVIMSSDEQFKEGDKVDLDSAHHVIRRLDDDSIVVDSISVYGRY